MDQNSVIERLKKFVLSHPDMAKNGFIRGLDSSTGQIVIMVNGEEKRITIDELENGHLNTTPKKQEEQIEVMEEEPKEEIETLEVKEDKKIVTLKDLNDAIIAKDETSINKALETFAINEKTGSIDINKAIKTVTDNSTNNVVESVKNGFVLPSELQYYDIKGNIVKPVQKGSEPLQNSIDKSFNNILVYVEAAKLRNIVYNDSQVLAAKSKYTTGINDKLNVLGLNKKEESNAVEFKQKENEKTLSMELKPDKDLKKAGFADIFILTIIVSIYAAIIINLISKLK